jgi:hypothetical protein
MTQFVTTSNYNSLTSLDTLEINVTVAHINPSDFTSRFFVTANILQLTSNEYLLSWQPSHTNLLFFSSLTQTQDFSLPCITRHCTLSLIVLVITFRHRPHRKDRSFVAVQLLPIRNLLPSSGRFYSHYSATVLHATVSYY